ncbi:MAG: hypothetical protein E6J69_19470 [Deltaproteobacteria bacterium]|nr:MAG: hypothetical protein E6J69_19470 [Deltaproteobacteria bacterium]
MERREAPPLGREHDAPALGGRRVDEEAQADRGQTRCRAALVARLPPWLDRGHRPLARCLRGSRGSRHRGFDGRPRRLGRRRARRCSGPGRRRCGRYGGDWRRRRSDGGRRRCSFRRHGGRGCVRRCRSRRHERRWNLRHPRRLGRGSRTGHACELGSGGALGSRPQHQGRHAGAGGEGDAGGDGGESKLRASFRPRRAGLRRPALRVFHLLEGVQDRAHDVPPPEEPSVGRG